MSYRTPYGPVQMNEHNLLHQERGDNAFGFETKDGGTRMKCTNCGLLIVQTDGQARTRNTVQPLWAIEHFLVIEWP